MTAENSSQEDKDIDTSAHQLSSITDQLENINTEMFVQTCTSDFDNMITELLQSYGVRLETVTSSRGYSLSTVVIVRR